MLADRYVIEDLLAHEGQSESWRARDTMLARSVVLQVVPSSSPFAKELLAAAKKSSRVTDTRILQVLDAVDDGQISYVVREWASGQSLDVVLSEGPMSARRATWLMREVAAAMANAHRHGLAHRRLTPDSVVITASSGVKLIGLGTAAVLRSDGADGDDPELEDTLDIGRLLYACLTARWPGDDATGLPIAPTEHGRLLRPRQVRAGVPRALDAVCDRILGQQSRYGDPITTVAEVKESLARILADEGVTTTGTAAAIDVSSTPSSPLRFEPPPAVLPRDGEDPPTGEQAVVPPRPPERASLGRTLAWTALILLLLGAVLLAYLIGQQGSGEEPGELTGPGGQSSSDPSVPDPVAIPIAGVTDFDPPPGSGDENPDQAPLAVDKDPSSAWTTLEYERDPHLGNLKDGVGLIVDLGETHAVSSVTVSLIGSPTDLELRAAPASATSPPSDSADEYNVVAELTGQGSEATFTLEKPVNTRYLLIWLTSLPPIGADTYQGGVADISVMGQ